MTACVAVGIVARVRVSICGTIATFKTLATVDEVNDRLPKEEQFDPLGWSLSKSQCQHREYKRLCPAPPVAIIGCLCTGDSLFGHFALGVLDFSQSERLRKPTCCYLPSWVVARTVVSTAFNRMFGLAIMHPTIGRQRPFGE